MIEWNDKLLTRHRAADMAGTWHIKVNLPYLRCGQCGMNIMMLPSDGMLIDVDGIISRVVSHMTTSAHGYNLSGARDER